MVKKSSFQNDSESKAGVCPVLCNCREQKGDWQHKYQGMNVLFLFFLSEISERALTAPDPNIHVSGRKSPSLLFS